MSYEVRLAKPAIRTLDQTDRTTERRLRKRLKELSEDPCNPRLSKTVVSYEGLRSSRVGGWRILYTTNEEEKTIYVLAIRPRGDAYKLS